MIRSFIFSIALLVASTPLFAAEKAMRIDWPMFFAKVSTQGVDYSDALTALDGKRVILRGYTVTYPKIDGGLLLAKDPYSDPHDVDETDVPFDAVAIVWKKDLQLPPIPRRPTIEGTLHLGNRAFGSQIVLLTIDEAEPASIAEQP